MKSYQFAIVASGLDPESEDFEGRFFEAGCDDATISFQRGAIILEFNRDARSFIGALVSAVRDVRKAGAHVQHVEPDYLVSLSDIAARAGLTRAAITNYAKGVRGSGFPAPIARVTTNAPLWDWVDVSRWLYRRNLIDRYCVVQARITKAVSANISGEPVGHIPREEKLEAELSENNNLAA